MQYEAAVMAPAASAIDDPLPSCPVLPSRGNAGPDAAAGGLRPSSGAGGGLAGNPSRGSRHAPAPFGTER